MSRYRGPKLKVVRRLGTPLPGLIRTEPELRRPYPPGQHGPGRRGKLSDYALRLREKQKVRMHYGVSENQFRRYVKKAFRGKGNPGIRLLTALESRLDNVVFRCGFTRTIPAARQLTRHGHLLVNGKKVDIPSYAVSTGDVLTVNPKSNWVERAKEAMSDPDNLATPTYLTKGETDGQMKVNGVPARDDIPLELNEQLIVEYYSGQL